MFDVFSVCWVYSAKLWGLCSIAPIISHPVLEYLYIYIYIYIYIYLKEHLSAKLHVCSEWLDNHGMILSSMLKVKLKKGSVFHTRHACPYR